MSRERNEIKAGIFLIVTFLIAIAVVVRIKGSSLGAVQTRTVAFSLSDDLGGLRVGDDVRLGGYKIGTVQDIRPQGLDGPEPKMLVRVMLPAQYAVRRDAVVGVQTGLTGATNLNIQSLGTGAPSSVDQPLVGRPDPKTALLASLGNMGPHLQNTIAQLDTQTMPKVTQAVDSAKTLLQHADRKVDPIVARYDKVADNASRAMGEFGDLLGDTKPDIRGTLKNLNSASGVLNRRLPGLADRLTEVVDKVNASLTSAQSALQDVQRTAVNARDMTDTLRSVIVGNRSRFDGMIASLKTTSDNLKIASVEIRRSPWRLLYKPTPGEAANMNLYDSAREFAAGAGSLSDAAGALRDALHDPQADRAQIQKLVNELDTSFDHFHQVENKLWSTAKQ